MKIIRKQGWKGQKWRRRNATGNDNGVGWGCGCQDVPRSGGQREGLWGGEKKLK